ncbi:S-layer homology domain-containing protein [Paenibacillus sp. GCM10023250]|uniref:S-layer homology domain-containing protein n=1 Tax=Paenibacillus sp. GCM10023250 TaxID=3252648 RepID=UPI00361D1A8E
MKKTFKVLSSSTLTFSVLASAAALPAAANAAAAAPVKSVGDFKDLTNIDQTLAAKIDALLKKGVFEGVSEDTFGINQNMTRAEFAKVLDLTYGIQVPDSATSSFSDVKADNWASDFIEAAKKAGLINGTTKTTYKPAANVTLGELATAYVKGLGIKPSLTEHPWYSDAVKQAVARSILPAGANGAKVATRADLVNSAYGAMLAYEEANKPAKVSVASAEATGVQQVTVKFDRDLDTSKATLTLQRGSSTVKAETKWADDKKSATLTLTDDKLRAGEYSVTLGGLDAAQVDKTSASFKAEDETLKSIEFDSAVDTIAYSGSVIIKATPKNQYGESASFSAGNYTVYTSVAQFTKINKSDDGSLAITLKTNTPEATQGVSVIPVTVVNNDQHVTASRNFKLGTAPIITKLTLGAPQYSNAANAITGKGDTVKYDLYLADQYGNTIAYNSSDFKKDDVKIIWNDYIGGNNGSGSAVSTEIEDNGSNIPRLKISLNDNVDKSADYTFTVTNQAATAQGKVRIQSASVANKIEIGDFNDVIAAGDHDAYIPIVGYDANGKALSTEDLTSDTNRDRIKVSVSGAQSEAKILDSGAHKGSIHLMNVSAASKGSVSVTVVIATPNATSTATRNYTIADVRVPDRIREVAAPNKEIVAGMGYAKEAKSSFRYEILDQYGKPMDYTLLTNDRGNAVESNGVKYYVEASFKDASAGAAFSLVRDDSSQKTSVLADVYGERAEGGNAKAVFGGANETDPMSLKQFNRGLRVYASTQVNNATQLAGEGAKATLHVAIVKQPNGGTPTEITYVDKTIKAAAKGEEWTYAVSPIGSLYYTLDSGILPNDQTKYPRKAADSAMSKRINLTVTNAAGDKVAIPDDYLLSVTSSNPVAVQVGQDEASKKWYAMGYKPGTATLTVSYRNDKGEVKVLTQEVTVKSEAITVASLEADSKATLPFSTADKAYYAAANYAGAGAAAPQVPFSMGLMNLSFTDNYGYGYDSSDVQTYGVDIYGLNFSVENVSPESAASAGTVTVDRTGKVSISGGFKGTFDLTVTAPTGKSVTTEVNVK